MESRTSKRTQDAGDVTVAIPTYGREETLITTLRHVLAQSPPAAEVLVADQTPEHEPQTQEQLSTWHNRGRIQWLRLREPSITGSMNVALQEAACPIVLFLDDDCIPAPGLVAAHAAAYREEEQAWAVSGQVLQPGEEPLAEPPPCTSEGLRAHLAFSFCSMSRTWVQSVMAGNLSVRRDRALEVGGFDENFVGVAYRFETEFCRRIWSSGGKVLYEPAASIRHLRAERGGTRRFGNHLCSWSPVHGVGDYYFALRYGVGLESLLYMVRRPFSETCTRFHIKRPWWIPVKLTGELLALLWAAALTCRGPKLASSDSCLRPPDGEV